LCLISQDEKEGGACLEFAYTDINDSTIDETRYDGGVCLEMFVEKSEGGIYVVKAMVVIKEELEDTAECLAHIIGERSEASGVGGSQGRVSVPTGHLVTGPEEESRMGPEDDAWESPEVIGSTPLTKEEFHGDKVEKQGKGMFDIDDEETSEKGTEGGAEEPETEMPQMAPREKKAVEPRKPAREISAEPIVEKAVEDEGKIPEKEVSAEPSVEKEVVEEKMPEKAKEVEEPSVKLKARGKQRGKIQEKTEEDDPAKTERGGGKQRGKVQEETEYEEPAKQKGPKGRGKQRGKIQEKAEDKEPAKTKGGRGKQRGKVQEETGEEESAKPNGKGKKAASKKPPVRTSLEFKPATATQVDWDVPMNEDDKEAAASTGGKKRKSTRGAGKKGMRGWAYEHESENEELSDPDDGCSLPLTFTEVVSKRAKVVAAPRAAPLSKKKADPKVKVASKKKAKDAALKVDDYPDEMSDLGSQELKGGDQNCGGLLVKKVDTPSRRAAEALDLGDIFGDGLPLCLTS
jgi:hypothetical protein